MTALFSSRFDGQPGSNYDDSAIEVYEANGTEDGQPIGVLIAAYGDNPVIPDKDVPRLVDALNAYMRRRGELADLVRKYREDHDALTTRDWVRLRDEDLVDADGNLYEDRKGT